MTKLSNERVMGKWERMALAKVEGFTSASDVERAILSLLPKEPGHDA